MSKQLIKIIDQIVDDVTQNTDMLNELDAVMGDGEHGSNIKKCFLAIKGQLPKWESQDDLSLFNSVGTKLLSAGGGTASTLLGFASLKISSLGKKQDNLNAQGIAQIAKGMLESVAQRSKAQQGDKTLMDALIPAIHALCYCAAEQKSINECFAAASAAADEGVEATKKMIAKRGRGLYVGERGLGVADPGATSISLIFRSISNSLNQTTNLNNKTFI